jgi:glycosyltransferase involved in cell wall biosynthesis
MGNSVFHLATVLSNLGHNVEVLTPGFYSDREVRPSSEKLSRHDEDVQHSIDFAKRLSPSMSYGNAARLSGIDKELDQADIVHLHFPFFGTAHLVKKWKHKHPDRPLVMTYHMDARAPGLKGLFFKVYDSLVAPGILNSADRLIGSSFDYIDASDAAAHKDKHKDKWVELPFGVDTTHFTVGDKVSARRVCGIDQSQATVLFVGGMDRAHQFKGVGVLLRAICFARKMIPGIHAMFVGDGDLRESYMREAQGLGIRDNCTWLGHVPDDDLPFIYQAADLLVLPSVHSGEAFGMVLLEAFASGVPVLASDLPGVRSVAVKAGDVVPPDNPYALAEAIEAFFNASDAQRAALSDKAREVAESEYDWAKIGTALEQIYLDMR